MKRKYDIRNKRSFVIILILSIAVICIFSLFIYKYKQSSKIEYLIETGSVIQDVNKNFINIQDDALLKIRWNDSYYLIYQDNKINLGKKVIVYNSITKGMKLYGTFYQIQEDGKIIDNRNETVLSNTASTKFYKLDDREYLLVDSNISSRDGGIQAENYLLVELDRMGNAKLSNYKIDLKTINPTTLVTSEYVFDIANEILNFGQYDIDLKKIIGSSNQYKPEENEDDDKESSNTGNNDGVGKGNVSGGNGTGTGIGSGDATGGSSGSGIGTGGGSDDVINNNEQDGEDSSIEDIKDKTKMTSVIRVIERLTQIEIDYVIYDPYNEYKSVYAEIVKPDKIEKIYLSKNETNLVFNGLNANTEYDVKFVYTTSDSETGELIYNTFEELSLKTGMPKYSISLYKLSTVANLLTYKVKIHDDYSIDKVNVSLSFKYKDIDTESNTIVTKDAYQTDKINVSENSKVVLGTFDISDYVIDEDTALTLTIDSVEGEYGKLDVGSSDTFRFGGKANETNS